jgi:hypothetical protein
MYFPFSFLIFFIPKGQKLWEGEERERTGGKHLKEGKYEVKDGCPMAGLVSKASRDGTPRSAY